MKRFVFLAVAIASFSCGTARGDIVYDLFFRAAEFGDGLDKTFNATSGQSFTGVEAVVRETVSDLTPSAFGASNVNGFGINIGVAGSDGSISNKVTNTTGGNPAFSDGPNSFAYFAFAGGRVITNLGGGVREFVLGTLDFTAPTAGSTTFSLTDPNPGNDGDITTFSGPGAAGLEPLGAFRMRSITLSAVPEPSSLMVIGLCAGLGLVRRRTRSA